MMKFNEESRAWTAECESDLDGWTVTSREEFSPGIDRVYVRRIRNSVAESRMVFLSVGVMVKGLPLAEANETLARARPGDRITVGGGSNAGTWVAVDPAVHPNALTGVWCNVDTGLLRHFSWFTTDCTGIVCDRWGGA